MYQTRPRGARAQAAGFPVRETHNRQQSGVRPALGAARYRLQNRTATSSDSLLSGAGRRRALLLLVLGGLEQWQQLLLGGELPAR